jgi:F-type H+-transporting ATPase subunit epsilon
VARGRLSLEIVTPQGAVHTETGVEGVVVRRKEERPLGSEMLILPGHGPMLARVQACNLRVYKDGRTRHLEVEGGFLEVRGDKVTLVTKASKGGSGG